MDRSGSILLSQNLEDSGYNKAVHTYGNITSPHGKHVKYVSSEKGNSEIVWPWLMKPFVIWPTLSHENNLGSENSLDIESDMIISIV